MTSNDPTSAGDFSLVTGGPLYRCFLRARLARPPLELLRRRMLVLPLLLWLPLLVLTLIEGRAWSGVRVPFLCDIETWARFLIALPVLLFAEVMVHQRLRRVIGQFTERGMVTEEVRPQFDAALSSAVRLRDSKMAELIILVTVLVLAPWLWHHGMALQGATWYANVDGETVSLTMAGRFFVFAAAPLFQFILLRWLFRLFIWGRFLWQASRLPLAILPTHPDRAGGLGFLGGSGFAFGPVLFAQGVVLSGFIASRVLFNGQSALDFRADAAMLIALAVVLVLGPQLFFSRALAQARRNGMREYGILAAGYMRAFDHKWLRGGAPADELLIGSADVQSLADMSGSYDVVREMSVLPFGYRAVMQLAGMTAAPLAPLVLTVIPAAELLDRLLKVLL